MKTTKQNNTLKASKADDWTKTRHKFIDSTLRIRKKDIPVRLGMMKQADLQFYPENPRVYSVITADGESPSQAQIQKALVVLDHVKQLAQSISANGGLTDAVLVRDGDNVVLEGNCRLAAYRLLAGKNPTEFGYIKVQVLPADISETDVFVLLGEYHIIGKKDWAPYEQAGYLYRRHTRQGGSLEDISREVGLSLSDVKRLVGTYTFMVDHKENNPERWSYYYEYLKHRTVRKARGKYPQLDTVVVAKVRSGDIPRAVDVRDRLKVIAASPKALKAFVTKKKSFEHSYAIAESSGAGNVWYKRLRKFRTWLATAEVYGGLSELDKAIYEKCVFELKRIQRTSAKLLDKAGEKTK